MHVTSISINQSIVTSLVQLKKQIETFAKKFCTRGWAPYECSQLLVDWFKDDLDFFKHTKLYWN